METDVSRPFWVSKKLWVFAVLFILNVLTARAVPHYQWVAAGQKYAETAEQLDKARQNLTVLEGWIEDAGQELAQAQDRLSQAKQGGWT